MTHHRLRPAGLLAIIASLSPLVLLKIFSWYEISFFDYIIYFSI